jgi:hypothetical protein
MKRLLILGAVVWCVVPVVLFAVFNRDNLLELFLPPRTISAGLGDNWDAIQAGSTYQFSAQDRERRDFILTRPVALHYTRPRGFSFENVRNTWLMIDDHGLHSVQFNPHLNWLTWDETEALATDAINRVDVAGWTPIRGSSLRAARTYYDSPEGRRGRLTWVLQFWEDAGDYVELTLHRQTQTGEEEPSWTFDKERFTVRVQVRRRDAT